MRSPNSFASADLDRQSHLRLDEAWLRTTKADPGSRITFVWRSRSLIRQEDETASEPPCAVLLPMAELRERHDSIDSGAWTLVYLGNRGEQACFAADVSVLDEPLAELGLDSNNEFSDLRQIGGLLEHADGALLAYARAMMTWHQRHRFCGVCSAPTDSVQSGHLRRCSSSSCAAEIFPRTDPAVIMLVTDGDWCLLGRQATWARGVYSTLAGFVEPGESLEDAVRREVAEEACVAVEACEYHSSQPWPFPTSLMLGFHARASRGEVRVDESELEEARWFSRQQILDREVRLPPPLSIARRLIDDWLREG